MCQSAIEIGFNKQSSFVRFIVYSLYHVQKITYIYLHAHIAHVISLVNFFVKTDENYKCNLQIFTLFTQNRERGLRKVFEKKPFSLLKIAKLNMRDIFLPTQI